MFTVLLSAGIPLPGRSEKVRYVCDVLLIREAIKALVVAIIEKNGRIVFGGHPAITPLIAFLFDDFGYEPDKFVTLYQSALFVNEFPFENRSFGRRVIVESVDGDKTKSLLLMRQRMIGDSCFDKAVFVGGKEGVIEEFNLFSEKFGVANAIPLASTGAAAREIFDLNPLLPNESGADLTYLSILRNAFSTRQKE